MTKLKAMQITVSQLARNSLISRQIGYVRLAALIKTLS